MSGDQREAIAREWKFHLVGRSTAPDRAPELTVYRPSGSVVAIPLTRDDLLAVIEQAARLLRNLGDSS